MDRLPRTGPLLEVRLAAWNVSAMDCGEDWILSSPCSRSSAGPIWIAHSWRVTAASPLPRLLPMMVARSGTVDGKWSGGNICLARLWKAQCRVYRAKGSRLPIQPP